MGVRKQYELYISITTEPISYEDYYDWWCIINAVQQKLPIAEREKRIWQQDTTEDSKSSNRKAKR